MRHDHKFELSQAEFSVWCFNIIQSFPDYKYELTGIGDPPPSKLNFGFCTQIPIFRLIQKTHSITCQKFHNHKLIFHFLIPQKSQKNEISSVDCNFFTKE